MKPEEFSFWQHSNRSNIREHLEAIQRHTEAASRIPENQIPQLNDIKFQPKIQLPPHIKLDSQDAYQPGDFKFVADPGENTFVDNSLPNRDARIWDIQPSNHQNDEFPAVLYPPIKPEGLLSPSERLAAIKHHTQSAMDLLGVSFQAPKDDPPTLSITIGEAVWLFVLAFALGFCGRHSLDQEPQRLPEQNQGFLNNTPALVESVA